MKSISSNDTFQSALLLTILEESPDFFAVQKKSDRSITFVNKNGIGMFEEDGFDALAQRVAAMSIQKDPPAEEDAFYEEMDKAIAAEGVFQQEREYITATGKVFWGTFRKIPFAHANEEYYLLHLFDTTINHHYQEKFKKQIHRFEALFNYASVGIVACNDDGIIVMANHYVLNQFKYNSEEELKGQKIEVLIPHRFRQHHEANRKNYHVNPHHKPMGYGMDVVARKKDGSEFPVEVSLSYYDIEGENYTISFISDITQRKRAEEEITKLNEELEKKVRQKTSELHDVIGRLKMQVTSTEQAKEKLNQALTFQKSLLDKAGVMIIATDSNGIIKLFNPKAEELLGYSAEELIGKHTPVIFHEQDVVKQRATELSEELNQAIAPGFEVFVAKARLDHHNENEWEYIRKNGSRFPVLLTITALRDEFNKITGFLGIATDISERKKGEELLLSALKKEKELNELKTRFVSIASHEFRTPLSTITSSTYLISKYEKMEDQPRREKHINRIVSSVNVLTETLNDFLSVGKIEEGKIYVRNEKFDITKHVSFIYTDMEVLLKAGQHINYTHSGSTLVTLDPALLKHIVENLLSNSIKFSGENSLIEIKTKVDNGKVELRIKDEGIGISKPDLQHLYQRFFRGNNAMNIQGTGLGLNIVKKYTELMNGTITCQSELEKGTTFILNFINKQQITNSKKATALL